MANPRDLSRLMELAKKRAELEFGKNVLGQDTDFELKQVSKAHAELGERVKSAGIDIIIPQAEKLEELQKIIADFSHDDLRQAFKIRDGKVYHFLTERGRIVKRNFENRMEIAKISLIVSKLKGDEKAAMMQAIRNGMLSSPLKVKSIDGKILKTLVLLMTRCGISAEVKEDEVKGSEVEIGEVRMEVSHRSIWIEKSLKPKLEENVKKMQEVNSVIQLKNAERQIKIFDNDEEMQFSTLQQQYLDLLKEQDEILKQYNEEEKL
jgi:hypothetical protein